MLKTQLFKAIYLCLICFFTSSFVPGPSAAATISSPDGKIGNTASFATGMQSAKISMAPRVKLNKQALQFANHYIRASAEDLVNIRHRSKTPFSIMDAVFSRYKLPVELKYLAVIESELKTSALSRVGALGPWQLMPGTAHDLGLKITRQYDERTSYYKSTKAAALYLRDLYAQFGDWLLVLAAYNSGPRPVLTAIRKSGSRNFWALQRFLPAETRGHVKRFIATHYYFEGQGSVTTLTKAENIEFAKSVNAYVLSRSSAAPVSHSTTAPAKEEGTGFAIGAAASGIEGITSLLYKFPTKNEGNRPPPSPDWISMPSRAEWRRYQFISSWSLAGSFGKTLCGSV